MKITLITTGGTIDGADSDKGSLRTSSDAALWLSKQKEIKYEVINYLIKTQEKLICQIEI
jgi:hypothetical protein